MEVWGQELSFKFDESPTSWSTYTVVSQWVSLHLYLALLYRMDIVLIGGYKTTFNVRCNIFQISSAYTLYRALLPNNLLGTHNLWLSEFKTRTSQLTWSLCVLQIRTSSQLSKFELSDHKINLERFGGLRALTKCLRCKRRGITYTIWLVFVLKNHYVPHTAIIARSNQV